MDGGTACKLALLKSIIDDLEAKVSALGKCEPSVSDALGEMQIGVSEAKRVITDWQGGK